MDSVGSSSDVGGFAKIAKHHSCGKLCEFSFAVKAGFLAGTVEFTFSFLINVFISARYVHFRFFF